MEKIIFDFIYKNLPTAIVLIVIAVVALVLLVWNLAILWWKFRHLQCEENSKALGELKQNSISKAELPCKAHNDKIEQHGLAVRSLETSIEYLNKNLERINIQLSNNGSSLTQQHSPLSISPRGWEVVSKLGMDKMFERNWSRIRRFIDDSVKNKNAYDINEFCIKYAVVYPEKFLQPEEIDILKNDAYAEGLTLMDYMKVIAVMARDEYLKENNIATE